MTDYGYLPCFRWFELPAKLQKVFGLIKPAVLSNHHQPHQIWLRLWPDKQNSLISLCKLKWAIIITNPEAVMKLRQPVIRIFSAHNLRCSTRQTSVSTLMLRSAPLSPSLHYCMPRVQMRTKHCSPLKNSEAPLLSGGITIMPCSLPVMLLLGMSFGPLFERITFPKDSLSESSMNF
jgi:hypothetical protein